MQHTTKTLKGFFATLRMTVLAGILLAGQNAFAQYFLKSYDFPPSGTRTDIGRSIEPVTVGASDGWTIAGFSNSMPGPGGYNWMFLKLTPAGVVSCATLLGFPADDSCFSHVKFSASPVNVLAGFYTMSSPSGPKEKASWSMVDVSCTHLMSRMIADTARHQYRWVTKNPSNDFTQTGFIERFMGSFGARDHILASQYSMGGSLLWAYEYTPPPGYEYVTERGYAICYQATDGTYAITGTTNRFTGASGPLQVFVMKISAAGIPIWFYGYSPTASAPSQSRRIVPLPDGGFAIAGWSPAYDPPGNDVYIFKIDAAGTLVWSNTYAEAPGVREEAHGLIYQPSDASLVFTGLRTIAPGSPDENILLGKVTAATGAPVWFTTYPNTAGPDRGLDLEEAMIPTGYAVTGQLFASVSTSLDPFLMRTDAGGSVPSGCMQPVNLQPRPGSTRGVCGRNIRQLPDMTIQPQVINPVPVVRQLCGDLTGVTGNGNEIPNEYALYQNYPNPFNPSTVISYQITDNSYVKLKVYDATGREAAVLVDAEMNAGTYEIEWDASGYPSGIYFYKLETNGFTDTKKMILMK
jgi:hypothetical protein